MTEDVVYVIRQYLKERRHAREVWRAYMKGVTITAVVMLSLFVVAIANAQVPRDAYEYRRDIIRTGRAYWGLDAPTAAFAAQIHQESYWKPDARSRVGATGLAQFMPRTADWISGSYGHLGENQPLNPDWAIRALITYDRHLYERVAATSKCERLAFALSAYNGGLGWVNKRKRLSEIPDRCFNATCDINPGITEGNQRENREYPRRILLKHEPAYAASGFGVQWCGGYGERIGG